MDCKRIDWFYVISFGIILLALAIGVMIVVIGAVGMAEVHSGLIFIGGLVILLTIFCVIAYIVKKNPNNERNTNPSEETRLVD